MKQREFKRWKKYRKIGELKFTLLWGLYLIIILNLSNLIVGFIKDDFNFYLEYIFIRIIIGGLFGVFAGNITWKGNEREYINHIKNNKL